MAGYKRRSKEFKSLSLDDYLQALSDDAWPGLEKAGQKKADSFIGVAKARYGSLGGSQTIAAAGARVAQHIKRVDTGKEYPRKNKYSGVTMPVQLIVTHNAKASAIKLEYGSGRDVPAYAVLRKLVAGMKGKM